MVLLLSSAVPVPTFQESAPETKQLYVMKRGANAPQEAVERKAIVITAQRPLTHFDVGMDSLGKALHDALADDNWSGEINWTVVESCVGYLCQMLILGAVTAISRFCLPFAMLCDQGMK